jgi:hypothetical protein
MMKLRAATGWDKADLFFLDNAIRRGMSAENVAGFLGRTADEVRAKARQLDIIAHKAPVTPRFGERTPSPSPPTVRAVLHGDRTARR